jgi:hypothetical protein
MSTYTYRAIEAYACFSEYGEQGDLTDHEIQLWDEYRATLLEDEPEDSTVFTIVGDEDTRNEFGLCEITGLMGATIEYTVEVNR